MFITPLTQLEAATSSGGGEYVDLFGTNPSTPHDTYIPAHGNPGVINDATPDPNYVPPHANDGADLSWAIGTTIE